jgi:tetratricopeptide (TPR) repeat protein
MRRYLVILFAAAIATAILSAAGSASALVRSVGDQEVVDRMRSRSPNAVKLLEEGEALAVAGSLTEALARFQQGLAADPMSSGLFERRQCEVLSSLGRPKEAQDMCFRALQDLRTSDTLASVARSLISGPDGPTPIETMRALTVLGMQRIPIEADPVRAAAMCDLARTIGDGIMLERCTQMLERIAPDYAATRRARALLDERCPPARFWVGWITILSVLVLTAVSALRRTFGRALPGGAVAALALAVALGLTAWSSVAQADQKPDPHGWLSKWPVDDDDPAKSVPTPEQLKDDPLQGGYWLQDALSKAEIASKHGNHAAAVKYYEASLKAVPNRALPLIKMCDEFEAMGDMTNAINACGLALLGEGLTVRDYDRYVRLMMNKPTPLSDKEHDAVLNVLKHVMEEQPAAGNELQCEVGTRWEDAEMLRQCTTALMASSPNDVKTITYRWALAIKEGNLDDARALLDRGAKAGMAEESLKRMRDATEAGAKRRLRARVLSGGGLVLLAGALAYGYVLLSRRKRQVPAAA